MRYFLSLLLFCASLFADAHIFCYHGFDDPRVKYQHTNVSAKTFLNQLNTMKAEGKKIVPLSSIVSALKTSKPLEQNIVSLTIDDAFKSFYEVGFPILRDAKIPFTLLVYVEAVDSRFGDYMTWDQVREVAKYGEVALHSYSHKDLTKLAKAQLIDDTLLAFKKFEKELGMRPKYYAYPFGFYNLETKNTLKAFGFDAILTVDGGAVNEFSDVFSLERVPTSENASIKAALSLKPLDIIIEKQSGNELRSIGGRVKNFDGTQIKMFTAKGNVKTLELDKDGAFETQVDMKKINARHRLVFKADNNRYRTKLIEKD